MPAAAVRKWWLNHMWNGEGMTLSNKINNVTRMDDINTVISNSLKDVDKWQSAAKTLVN